MPTALQGFFIAALFGAILSTFNSFLNSAATIYCKDLLPSISKKQRTDQELIVYAKKVSTIMAIVTMIIGPLLMYCLGVQCENQFRVCDGWIIRI